MSQTRAPTTPANSHRELQGIDCHSGFREVKLRLRDVKQLAEAHTAAMVGLEPRSEQPQVLVLGPGEQGREGSSRRLEQEGRVQMW